MWASRWTSATGLPSVRRDPAPAIALQDRPRDRVIAADGHRARAGIGDAAEEGADALDAGLVVHRLGQRDIAQVVDAARLPGGEVVEGFVQPPVVGRDVAHRARTQMLVALRGAVAGGVRARRPGRCRSWRDRDRSGSGRGRERPTREAPRAAPCRHRASGPPVWTAGAARRRDGKTARRQGRG